jgi:hypothetical protein
VVCAARVIDAYAATAGATREAVAATHMKQAGDPRKLAKALLALADAQPPPLRFPAGADAIAWFETECGERAGLDGWRELAVSLAHED